MEETAENKNESFVSWMSLGILFLAAILLVLAGGRTPPEKAPAEDAKDQYPELVEPAGELDDPPLRFVWNPGGEDVDLSQVVVYRSNLDRIWETIPLGPGTREITIPLQAYAGTYPGEPCFWRVLEARDGRSRAVSALKEFKFKNPPQLRPEEKLLR
jgi:hypothetical protein